jgi:protein-S-isoprenylcysteine O-methyltransferase Ste14
VVVLGQAWLFGSARLVEYAAVMALCFHLFVLTYEERTLARRYGAAYQQYLREVPRWIPRRPRSRPPGLAPDARPDIARGDGSDGSS